MVCWEVWIPWLGWLCVRVDHLISPSPLSHDWCMVRTDPPPFGGHVWPTYTEFRTRILQYPESLSHGPVISLIGSLSSSSSTTTPSSSTPWERVSWPLFGLSLCFMSMRLSGCPELFANSFECPLPQPQGYSPWVRPRTNFPLGHNRTISDLSGLESDGPLSYFLRLPASDNKDQPSPT